MTKSSHAIDEHQEIKRLLSEVDKMSSEDPARDARVLELITRSSTTSRKRREASFPACVRGWMLTISTAWVNCSNG